MRILLNLKDLGLSPKDPAQMGHRAFCSEILTHLVNQFNDQSHDKEAYIYEEFEEDQFMLGREEPLGILKAARAWNQEIRNEFVAAVNNMFHVDVTGRLPEAKDIPMDNQDTYRLANAARELDNNWFDYADHTVLKCSDSGQTYYVCALDDSMLKELEAHPEDFAIVEVYIK